MEKKEYFEKGFRVIEMNVDCVFKFGFEDSFTAYDLKENPNQRGEEEVFLKIKNLADGKILKIKEGSPIRLQLRIIDKT